MYIRCSDCLSTCWVDVLTPEGVAEFVECGACSRRFGVALAPGLGVKASDHYRATISLAQKHDLEMPSAYAVLVGIMTLDQAQILRLTQREDDDSPDRGGESSVGGASASVAVPVADDGDPDDDEAEEKADDAPAGSVPEATAAAPERLTPDIDPGYHDAITRGSLTLQQALIRGDRQTYVARLMRRHGLSKNLALRVTDNRMSISEALRRNRRAPRAPRKPKAEAPRSTRSFPRILATLAVLVLGFVALRAWTRDDAVPVRTPVLAPAPPVAPPAKDARVASHVKTESAQRIDRLLSATEVRGDDEGRVVEIVGPDPRTVLRSYCDSFAADASLEALEVTSTVPPFREARLGLFRDYRAEGAIFAIRIRRDRTSGRWIAGSGRAPIVPRQPPELPPDALRIPVGGRPSP